VEQKNVEAYKAQQSWWPLIRFEVCSTQGKVNNSYFDTFRTEVASCDTVSHVPFCESNARFRGMQWFCQTNKCWHSNALDNVNVKIQFRTARQGTSQWELHVRRTF
jgi:hypothetical protein